MDDYSVKANVDDISDPQELKRFFLDRERALIEAKEYAEIANQAKSELLVMISHELRIPLVGMIGMAKLLSIDALLPGQRSEIEEIVKGGEHLLSLVDDLSRLAKLETGEMKLQVASFDLRLLIEEITKMLAFQAEEKGIGFLVDYEEEVPHLVMGDVRVLRQVLLNLVENALKFTEHGYILIKVACLRRAGAETELELSVQDTGVGIAVDKQQLLIQQFSQKQSSLIHRYDSGNLGLTISKAFIELMNGRMNVRSEVGRGSIFSCVIPFTFSSQKPRKADALSDR